MKLEASNPASKGCKGLAGIYWDLASYGSVPALIGRITEEFVRNPPAHLLPESLSTPVVEHALISLVVEATGGPARFAVADNTACSTAPDAEQQHSQQQRQERKQQQQSSFFDELERRATWASFEQAVRHAGKESGINEALTTQLLAAVRVTLALRRADLIRAAAKKCSRFAGRGSSSEGSTEAELPSPEPVDDEVVADVAGDEAGAAAARATSAASSACCPVEQHRGSSAMSNQPTQMEHRQAAAAKSDAARLGSPGAASPGPQAASTTPSGHSCGPAGVRAPRNGGPSVATAAPAAERHVQPKQRPSTSPRFGRVAHGDSASTAGSPPASGPHPEVFGVGETSTADAHCLGRMPTESVDPLQWLTPPLDVGEGPTAEWRDTEVDICEGPVQRSSGEPGRHGQGARDPIPVAASRLSVQSNGTGRGRGGRGRGSRARGGAQHKASRWH